MIIVFVAHTHPPLVFETTSSLFVAQAVDHAAGSNTLPDYRGGMSFEIAWQAVTRDLKAAFHFVDIPAARTYFENDTTLGLHARSQILSALARMDNVRRVAGADGLSASDGRLG